MTDRTFEHAGTVFIHDPDFMPIFLQPCGMRHVVAVQTWCAYLIDVEEGTAKRIDYPAWAWNVSSSQEPEPALTVYFELHRELRRCPLNVETGKLDAGEVIPEKITLPEPQPPHLVTEDAIWFSHGGRGHSLIAARYDRMTDLTGDISRIAPADFFLLGPDKSVFLHRWDVGLIKPHPVDQPDLVVNYRTIGCSEPRGAAFDESGKLWVLDEHGPALSEVDIENRSVRVHDISPLHRQFADPSDPSPYPWHSCAWCRGLLAVGCCDAARIDILRPLIPPS